MKRAENGAILEKIHEIMKKNAEKLAQFRK